MLIRQLLGESVETLERWQNLLRTALGPAALTLVTEILPELDMIVGDEPNSEIRTDQTSAEQNAFVRAMQGLIGVFAQSEHPLVIFLDDIQVSFRIALVTPSLILKITLFLYVARRSSVPEAVAGDSL